MNHFSIRLWSAMKNGLYTATSNNQLSGGAEKKLQRTSRSQTCTPVWLLLPADPLWWIPAKLLQLRVMLSKSMRWTEIGNDCSQLWSTERNQSFFRTKSDHTSHNQHFKSWMNWVTEFCFICNVHLTLSNRLPLLQATQQLFAGKMLSKSPLNPEAWNFMLQG